LSLKCLQATGTIWAIKKAGCFLLSVVVVVFLWWGGTERVKSWLKCTRFGHGWTGRARYVAGTITAYQVGLFKCMVTWVVMIAFC